MARPKAVAEHVVASGCMWNYHKSVRLMTWPTFTAPPIEDLKAEFALHCDKDNAAVLLLESEAF